MKEPRLFAQNRIRMFGAALAASALALTACSDGGSSATEDDSGGGEGLPSVITLSVIKELTGSAGFAGESALEGIELAIEEINDTDFLGEDVEVRPDVQDTASNTQTAVTMVGQAATNPDFAAILGPSNSDAGQAVAPIAQRAGIPLVFSQSLGDGILVGDYIFRVNAPLDSYSGLAWDYMADEGIETVSILYNSTSVRQSQGATEMSPAFAEERGIEILSSTGIPVTSTDFTAAAAQVANEEPDAVVYFMAGAQHVTAVQQVRRAGFEGALIGGSGIEAGLETVGEDGDGIVWATDYNYLWQNESALAFTDAYVAKYGENPLSYAAEAYDSVWWIARGLEESGDASHAGVQQGLTTVAEAGFDGAQGPLTFEDNDARTVGVLIQWIGGEQVLLRAGDE